MYFDWEDCRKIHESIILSMLPPGVFFITFGAVVRGNLYGIKVYYPVVPPELGQYATYHLQPDKPVCVEFANVREDLV